MDDLFLARNKCQSEAGRLKMLSEDWNGKLDPRLVATYADKAAGLELAVRIIEEIINSNIPL